MDLDDHIKTAKIPIRLIKGTFYLPNGKELPLLRDGAIGHIVVGEWYIVDEKERAKYTDKKEIKILPAKTTLLAHLNTPVIDQQVPLIPEDKIELDNDAKEYLNIVNKKYIKHQVIDTPFTEAGDYAEIYLKKPLFLKLRGTKDASLNPCACRVLFLEMDAISINQAYTLLSERLEPQRKSHTGNVFRKVYYKDNKNIWKPLKLLRDKFHKSIDEEFYTK